MYIRVKVFPKSKKDNCLETSSNTFKIYCKEKTENNRANNKIRELLAQHYTLPINCIHIISGHRRPQKMIQIKNT